jgi:hypothetical protein
VSSGDSALGGFGIVDAPDSVVLVCAPPLLLTVTPDPTWEDEVVALPVEVEPPLVDVDSAPAVDVAADPVDDSSDEVLLDVVLDELVEDDSDDVPVVSAEANP